MFDAFYTYTFFYSLTRDHVRARKEGFLRKVFQAWRGFIKATLQLEMQHFATSLSGLDSSFGSFTAPPFRNVLGSALGSTFGSTLGSPSPTMSDALTSSGYGASMRRGSGSVFTFGVLPKERDDDVSLNVQSICLLLLKCNFVAMRKLWSCICNIKDWEFKYKFTTQSRLFCRPLYSIFTFLPVH